MKRPYLKLDEAGELSGFTPSDLRSCVELILDRRRARNVASFFPETIDRFLEMRSARASPDTNS